MLRLVSKPFLLRSGSAAPEPKRGAVFWQYHRMNRRSSPLTRLPQVVEAFVEGVGAA